MKPRDHAIEFLLPVNPTSGVRAIARKLWHAAATDDAVAGKFATILELMGSGTPLINSTHFDLYQRLKEGVPPLDIPTAPEWIRPAIAAAYLRAKALVASGHVHGLLNHLDRRLDTVVELARKLEPEFVGELLVETMMAARDDREFARALVKGADEVRALATELYGPEGTDRPAALARASSGSGGGGSCVCCTDVNGSTQCAPCSCWIIIVIIVIIIVSK